MISSLQWFLHQDSAEPQILGSAYYPTVMEQIRLNLEQLLIDEKASKIIGNAIKYWPFCIVARQRLIDFALKKAWDFVESMPVSHNAVHLNLRVRPKLRQVIDERLAIRYATWRPMMEAEASMVPAVELSIESLESWTLMESRTRIICMEEFVNGAEGVLMPCLHIFHGDCIKKWLRISCYCPVCRFQMPITCKI